jgi:hypothetical protein
MDFEEKNTIINDYINEFRGRFSENTNSFIISELESYKEAVHSEIIYELSLEIKEKNVNNKLNISEILKEITRQISDIRISDLNNLGNNINKKSELREIIEILDEIIVIMDKLKSSGYFYQTGKIGKEERRSILRKLQRIYDNEHIRENFGQILLDVQDDFDNAYYDEDYFEPAQEKLKNIISNLEHDVTLQKPNNLIEICEAYSEYFRRCLQTCRLFMENLNIV